MRMLIFLTIPVFLGISCAPVTPAPSSAICSGTRAARADHAAALAISPDDAAVKTGARLVALIDAGCQP